MDTKQLEKWETQLIKQFTEAVAHRNYRPPIPSNCPPSWKGLIEQCWQPNANQRPSFLQILKELDRLLKEGDERNKNSSNNNQGKENVGVSPLLKSVCEDGTYVDE